MLLYCFRTSPENGSKSVLVSECMQLFPMQSIAVHHMDQPQAVMVCIYVCFTLPFEVSIKL